MLPVVVLTSDKYMWAMRPFAYLFNIYLSSLQPVTVGCFRIPNYFVLPPNFTLFQIDRRNYPADKWSDGLIKLLRSIREDHVLFMLEDYWLTRTVDIQGVSACYEYMQARPDVLRFDLTDDRQYAGGVKDVDKWGHYDIVETFFETPYQMSTQAGIWNRRLFLELLTPGKSAWEVEIHTQPPKEMRVLGTRQCPMRYANALLKGALDIDQLAKIPAEHQQAIYDMIPKSYLA
jgi:hypothetical protein